MQTRDESRMRHALAAARMFETGERLTAIALTAWRAWWPFIVIVGIYYYVATTMLPLKAGKGLDALNILTLWATLLAVTVPILAAVRLGIYAVKGFPPDPARRLLRDMRVLLLNPSRLLSLAILFPVVSLFMQGFAVAKSNIAFINPFSWDRAFMELDRLLHGGSDPWQYMQPFIQLPHMTLMINFFYNLWFFLFTGTVIWAVAMRKPEVLPLRYLIAFMLTWVIGGNLIATLFSSAGPVYFGRLGLSPDPYAPLMAMLHGISEIMPVWALDTQELLWKGYLAQDTTLGGISAFPSMHNAQAVLMALLAWQCNRKLGVAMIIYAMLIAIGSVWLGWHYAVDAYAGILIAFACWWLAAPLARWMLRRKAMRELIALQERLDAQARS